MAVPFADLEEIDRWALCKMQDLRARVLEAYADYEFHHVYHDVLNFCSVELSSFYFDILKDRVYTFAANSRERRSAQTALAEILTDLLKLLSPILAHTCDEAWQELPKGVADAESVHLSEFPPLRDGYTLSNEAAANWDRLLKLRGIVSKSLEEMRRNKEIGSSLEADVTLTPGTEDVEKTLKHYESQLESIFIVSNCTIAERNGANNNEELVVQAKKATGQKCARCWNYRDSVGDNDSHPALCSRCIVQLGETT